MDGRLQSRRQILRLPHAQHALAWRDDIAATERIAAA
jgi:hypothetical protein